MTKIERMNQINKFSRVGDTRAAADEVINFRSGSPPRQAATLRQKRQTLAKPHRIAKYEKDHKGSKSALQVLSSRIKNLN